MQGLAWTGAAQWATVASLEEGTNTSGDIIAGVPLGPLVRRSLVRRPPTPASPTAPVAPSPSPAHTPPAPPAPLAPLAPLAPPAPPAPPGPPASPVALGEASAIFPSLMSPSWTS
ncbi:hypothetical protein BC937DRAFT_92528 [Endogone sp. FLAS-F59071]|nr:hypothetical protein BC937DRAFT_92528 [Endogone sp. FLAS-F59071]|eukprot:RUS15385.1 hypothetical protein BC937DRAFT_92528 [Endogone sp. FLAS-F59071]